MNRGKPSEGVRILTEGEIQQRLYGEYLGKKKNPRDPSSPAQGSDPLWTGSEILLGELNQLRAQLIALRQEREQLEAELKRRTSWTESPAPRRVSGAHGGAFWGRFFAFLVVLGGIGTPLTFRLLQASPTSGEPTPYTIQVAVYDIRSLAQKTLGYLQELGYPAFLVEFPRKGGRIRYRIYLGRFITKEEAEVQRAKLISDSRFADAFVRLK